MAFGTQIYMQTQILNIQQQQRNNHRHAQTVALTTLFEARVIAARTAELRGDYPQARLAYQEALHTVKKIEGAKSEAVATLYSKLAEVAEAQAEYEQAINYLQAKRGDNHLEIANVWMRVGVVRFQQLQIESAVKFFNKALTITRAKLGKHERTATMHCFLGRVMSILGKGDESLDHYSEALTIYRDIRGKNHPTTLDTYNLMANSHKGGAQDHSVLRFHSTVLAITRRVFGEKHRLTADAYLAMAHALEGRDEAAPALDYFEKAVTIQLSVLGKHHADAVTTLHEMAILCFDLGMEEKALESFTKALDIRRKALGKHHGSTGETCYMLALLHRTHGNVTTARALFGEAHVAYKAAHGPNDERTQEAAEQLERC